MEHTFSDDIFREGRRSQGNFVLAFLAGLAAAAFSAVIWLITSLLIGWQDAGFTALGIGLLVGIAIRSSGRGSHFIFGILGVLFTLASCLLGSVLATIAMATTSSLDFYGVLMHLNMGFLVSAIIDQTSPLMATVYALATFEAFMLSFRK